MESIFRKLKQDRLRPVEKTTSTVSQRKMGREHEHAEIDRHPAVAPIETAAILVVVGT